MHCLALLQRGAQGAMQPVFEIQLAAVGHDVGEKVAVEGGIFFKQRGEIEGSFGGDQLIESNLARRDFGPLLLHVAVVGVGTGVTDALEDHAASLSSAPRLGSRRRRRFIVVALVAHRRGLVARRSFVKLLGYLTRRDWTNNCGRFLAQFDQEVALTVGPVTPAPASSPPIGTSVARVVGVDKYSWRHEQGRRRHYEGLHLHRARH